MAVQTVRGDLHPSVHFRTYAGNTARTLHSTDAPATAQHLPAALIVTGAGNLDLIDVAGVTTRIVFPAGHLCTVLPLGPAGMANTGDAAVGVTVVWQAEP